MGQKDSKTQGKDCETVFRARWNSFTHELTEAMTTCKDVCVQNQERQGGGWQISPQMLAIGNRWLSRAGESVFFKDALEVSTYTLVDGPHFLYKVETVI